MFYQEYPPTFPLKAFVHCIWILEDYGNLSNDEQRVLPDGKAELVVHYGDNYSRLNISTKKTEIQPRVLIIGQMKSHVILKPRTNTGMIGVRFKTTGASQFLRSSMTDFTNQIVDLKSWSYQCASQLEEQILQAKDHNNRINILQNFLMEKLIDGRPDLVLSKIIQTIVLNNGVIDFRNITNQFGIGERQLERKFLENVGLGPKFYARIIRFQSVIREKNSSPNKNLTDIAVEYGYYDQSHFINDFKAFSGLSPKNYFDENHQISDCFTQS